MYFLFGSPPSHTPISCICAASSLTVRVYPCALRNLSSAAVRPDAAGATVTVIGTVQLRVLVAIEETGSFSAAGRRLRRVQSAISHSVQGLEEAQGLQRLVQEFGLTHEQAAQAVGRSRSAATNLLRLLNLAEPVQSLLMAGDIDMGHARALLSLDKATQITAAHQISAKALSVREAEQLVKTLGAEFALKPPRPGKEKSRDIRRVEDELSDLLTATVEVRIKKRVKRHGRVDEQGELAIHFGSLDALNGLIERLRAG